MILKEVWNVLHSTMRAYFKYGKMLQKKRIKYKSNNKLMTELKSKQKQKINHMSIILK